MFHNEPWSKLPKDRVGLASLKTRLGELLGEIARKEFPNLRSEIAKELDDCEKERESLGPAREVEQEQRLFLSNMAKKFQNIANAALDARYSIDEIFESHEELRLITYIVNRTEVFSHDFEKSGHSYSFDDPSRTIWDEKGTDEEDSSPSNTDEARVFTAGIDADEFPILDSLVGYALPEEPKTGIMDWAEKLYIKSRGPDLGTFGGDVLASALKEQTRKWPDMTQGYLGEVIVVVHRFIVILLDVICADPHVRREIWAEIQEELVNRYKGAMNQALFLVSVEREKRPYTLNHYFNENLQIARNTRKFHDLEGKARRESTNHANQNGNLVVDLEAVKSAKSKSNLEQVKEEIHDILKSYYKVARKRFVDNVFSQAVNHFLLTGPKSPLAVFNQEWVITLDAERLDAIAGESSAVKARRKNLGKKIHELQTALRILRR
jgi:hypothetical protein